MKAVDYLGQIAGDDEPSYPYNYPPESGSSVRPPPTPPDQHAYSPRALSNPDPNDQTIPQPYSARANISPYTININDPINGYGEVDPSQSQWVIPDLVWQGASILLGATLGYFSERYYPSMYRVEGYGALIGSVIGNGIASWYLEYNPQLGGTAVDSKKWLISMLLPLAPIGVLMYQKSAPSPRVSGSVALAAVAMMYLADQQIRK